MIRERNIFTKNTALKIAIFKSILLFNILNLLTSSQIGDTLIYNVR